MSNFCSITANGKTIKCSGNNVAVIDGNIIVDGKVINSSITNNTKIVINGDVDKLECDGFVEVYGNAGSIHCGGSCTVSKDIYMEVLKPVEVLNVVRYQVIFVLVVMLSARINKRRYIKKY